MCPSGFFPFWNVLSTDTVFKPLHTKVTMTIVFHNNACLNEMKRTTYTTVIALGPICALKWDYPPHDLLYSEVVTPHREISAAVYCLHSGSMERERKRMVGGAYWCHWLYRDLPLNINTPCIFTQQHPVKQQQKHNWPWVQGAGRLKYHEAWRDLQWATSQVHRKSGGCIPPLYCEIARYARTCRDICERHQLKYNLGKINVE